MVGRGVYRYCEAAERYARRAVYAHRGAPAVLERPSERNTAVQDEIPSTTSDLTMSIAAAHRPVCAASVRTRGTRAIKWESVAAAHRRVRPWCREARRALSCDAEDR